MIMIENGDLCVKGTRLELTTEFMCIVNSLLEKGIIRKELMLNLIGLACIPEDEIKKAMIDYIDGMDDIGEALNLLGKIL